MPHFPTHNPLKKELNLENIYQKLPIGIELYDKEGNLIDTIIGKTKSTASQNEKYKKCRLISVYVKLKRHSFLV